MAKFITRLAAEDDPIFTGRLTISSENLRRELTESAQTSASDTAGPSTEKSTLPTETAAPPEGEP